MSSLRLQRDHGRVPLRAPPAAFTNTKRISPRMQASLSHVNAASSLAGAILFDAQTQPQARQALAIRVLQTPEERQEIAHLRKHADFRSEYELDPGMASLESVK